MVKKVHESDFVQETVSAKSSAVFLGIVLSPITFLVGW